MTFPGSAGAEHRHGQERADVFSLSNLNIWKITIFMGKSTISMAIFNSYMLVYQRVFPDNCHFLQNQYSSIFLPAMLQFLVPCISIFHPYSAIDIGRNWDLQRFFDVFCFLHPPLASNSHRSRGINSTVLLKISGNICFMVLC